MWWAPAVARRVQAGVAVTLASVATQRRGLGARCDAEPLKFGVIADIQYADVDDAENFAGTETRFYRGSLEGAARAVAGFPAGLAFVAQLGDLIDGQNAGQYGAGLQWADAPRSEEALGHVLAVLDRADVAYLHSVGNHELYNFAPAALEAGPLNRGRHSICRGGRFYYALRFAGWTVLQLNPYEVSSELPEGTPGYRAAADILGARNPNPVLTERCDFFEGLEGPGMRFVPFNGGLGRAQLAWLEAELAGAAARGDAAVVLSHLPLFEGAASWRNVAFDAPEALEIVQRSGVVACVFAGHSHRGGFAVDGAGVAHCTVQATLTHRTAFGVVECGADGSLALEGFGSLPSRDIPPPAGRRRRGV